MRLCPAVLSAALLAVTLTTSAQTPPPQGPPGYTRIRAHRADWLSQPDGWLSLVALEWLKPGDTTVGSALGNTLHLDRTPPHLATLHRQGNTVTLAAHDPSLTLDGKPALAQATLLPDDADHPSELRSGSILATVIHRGDRLYLRVKDAYAPTRARFHGLAWYPVDPHLIVTAHWIPAASTHTITIPNVLGQISHEPSPGAAEFTLNGHTLRLEPTVEGNNLFFVFRDTTSRSTTYGAGRFLTTAFPSNGLAESGTLVLDFNQAVNPPCAYTPYATCPLPPVENRLPIAIPAGEKRYNEIAISVPARQ